MNFTLDYDAVNAIKDLTEAFGPMKIFRNEKKDLLLFDFPMLLFLGYCFVGNRFLTLFPYQLVMFLLGKSISSFASYKLSGDRYKESAELKTKYLVLKLQSINVETTQELIKEAECYKRTYNLKLNEKKIPQIIDSKYILVPTYGINGEIVDESILQEHVVGSKTYVLSKGSPLKVLKPVFSNI